MAGLVDEVDSLKVGLEVDQVIGREILGEMTYGKYENDQTKRNFIAESVMPPYEVASDEGCDKSRSKLDKTQEEEDLKGKGAIAGSA